MRDIKKEIQKLKERAEKEFGGKGGKGSTDGFIERAAKYLNGKDKLNETNLHSEERLGKNGQIKSGIFLHGENAGAGLTRKLMERKRGGAVYKEERGAYVPFIKLKDAIMGKEEKCGRTSFYRIIDSASVVDSDAEELHERYRDILSSSIECRVEDIGSMTLLPNLPIEDVCYLDLETTGLSNSPLFLVGLMYSRDGKLVLDQFFARDYTEEEPLLEFTRDFLQSFSTIVTFNGKGFDIPFMLDRMKVFGIEASMPGYHVDLLPISRKIVGKRTPNHKLNTLETYLLGRKRVADVPGRLIPELYHDYVRTGNAADIKGIIKHNRIDLISLMRLIVFFLSDMLSLEEKD